MRLNPALSLAELQRSFQAAILAGDAPVPGFIAAACRETAESRFRIYREAYRLLSLRGACAGRRRVIERFSSHSPMDIAHPVAARLRRHARNSPESLK